jgi:hypothetical protein
MKDTAGDVLACVGAIGVFVGLFFVVVKALEMDCGFTPTKQKKDEPFLVYQPETDTADSIVFQERNERDVVFDSLGPKGSLWKDGFTMQPRGTELECTYEGQKLRLKQGDEATCRWAPLPKLPTVDAPVETSGGKCHQDGDLFWCDPFIVPQKGNTR